MASAKQHHSDQSSNQVTAETAPNHAPISEREVEDVEARSTPRTPVIYEIVRRLGEEEMARPVVSLWWSGLAAGLSISFSLLAQAVLQQHLEPTGWRPLVTSLGYSIGFLIVVLARQQLFTENTITVVLPVMANWSLGTLGRAARLWAVVLAANFAGTLFAAAFCSFTPAIEPDLKQQMLEISRHVIEHGWFVSVLKAIPAGFLIAAMVWLLPSAEGSQAWIIVVMTWLISAGGFLHIVAGSTEAFMLMWDGSASVTEVFGGFVAPVLIGNLIGGTALFALLTYAQVMKEME
ncbi:formate/nitrite transporter family protein [Rhodopseudomonas palustris]|uniref:Formate/nitrite transporter family protein n=1 Tax=Rhodopseudomonas palustris TaxID=1076 RepID=A0A323UQX7_RHOPL|nr:formate/nitrite transporter family protein [Rhodopseudomonas palustris]PZA13556.1 formate/nitrite transporter family protein [Rhodopseudomonas palustris]